MQILKLLRRFVLPYKGMVGLNLLFNFLSTILSLFSFAAIIPVLQILFGINDAQAQWTALTETMSLQETIAALKGNMYFYLQMLIAERGSGFVLFVLGLFLVVMTFFKCLTA